MVVELSVVLSMEAEAVGVGDGGVVDSAGELRATKGAGGGVADATDVVVNSFSNRWRLRSNARCILVNSKAAMIPLTLAEVVGDRSHGGLRRRRGCSGVEARITRMC